MCMNSSQTRNQINLGSREGGESLSPLSDEKAKASSGIPCGTLQNTQHLLSQAFKVECKDPQAIANPYKE